MATKYYLHVRQPQAALDKRRNSC